MKNVVTCILKEGDSKRFELDLAVGKTESPLLNIKRLLLFKNRMLREGEQPITLVDLVESDKVCYSHDWRVKGNHYMCRDCKVPGKRANPFAKILPTFEDSQYSDCRWKIKL